MIIQQPSPGRNIRHWLLLGLSLGCLGGWAEAAAPPARAQEQTSKAPREKMATLHESRPLVARTGAWQTYNDHIHIRPGQEKRALLITFINGADGREKLTDVQILLARKPFATLKDFDDSGRLTRSLTGNIGSGDSLLTVKVFGKSGARMVWNLLAEKATITAVNPNPFSLADKLTVQGSSFSEHPHAVKVLIAGKSALVLSASSTELQLKPPSHLQSGENELVVIVDSAKSDPFKVTVKAGPEVLWVDHISTCPGQPLVIAGKGFSSVASENSVTFGSIRARVLSATETRITCLVPEMHFPKWHVPITVTTNGIAAKRKGSIDIDIRVVPSETPPPP